MYRRLARCAAGTSHLTAAFTRKTSALTLESTQLSQSGYILNPPDTVARFRRSVEDVIVEVSTPIVLTVDSGGGDAGFERRSWWSDVLPDPPMPDSRTVGGGGAKKSTRGEKRFDRKADILERNDRCVGRKGDLDRCSQGKGCEVEL